MNIILTDCTGAKLHALEGVATTFFVSRSAYIIEHITAQYDNSHPLNLSELNTVLHCRIDSIVNAFEQDKYETDVRIYVATLQKSFFQIGDAWFFTAGALFGEMDKILFLGMTQSVPLLPAVWSFMKLAQPVRYEKMSSIYNMTLIPLISCILPDLNESDWFKQAFRSCIPIALNAITKIPA